jgi:hypothetical protein
MTLLDTLRPPIAAVRNDHSITVSSSREESPVESSEHQDNASRSQNRFLKNEKSTPTMMATIATT